jgi:hypothetical protein
MRRGNKRGEEQPSHQSMPKKSMTDDDRINATTKSNVENLNETTIVCCVAL